MKLTHALIVLLCLSLDGFVVMLKKGASLRELPLRKGITYALIFAGVNCAATALGYLLGIIFQGLLSPQAETLTAILIVFAIGIFFLTRAVHAVHTEERLDKSFNEKNCLRLALRTSPGSVLVGIGCYLLGFPFLPVILMVLGITFFFILAAMYIGYHEGSKLAGCVEIADGCLMVVYSVYLLSVYVLGPKI